MEERGSSRPSTLSPSRLFRPKSARARPGPGQSGPQPCCPAVPLQGQGTPTLPTTVPAGFPFQAHPSMWRGSMPCGSVPSKPPSLWPWSPLTRPLSLHPSQDSALLWHNCHHQHWSKCGSKVHTQTLGGKTSGEKELIETEDGGGATSVRSNFWTTVWPLRLCTVPAFLKAESILLNPMRSIPAPKRSHTAPGPHTMLTAANAGLGKVTDKGANEQRDRFQWYCPET